MPHPLVDQLRFARTEFVRALDGVTEEDGSQRLMPMNSLGWIVGHLASQERRYWLKWAQGRDVMAELDDIAGYGRPASTPSIGEMWTAWRAITAEADPWLDTLTGDELLVFPDRDGRPNDESLGTMMHRVVYHYFFHIGESQAVRQLLGHAALPEFVGDIGVLAPYASETPAG